MSFRSNRFLAIAITGGALLAAAGQARADEIHLRDGRVEKNISITDETYKEVKFRFNAGNVKSSHPLKDVERVEYEQKPKAFEKGLAAMRGYRFDEAIESFRTALRSTQRKWVKQYATHYLALSQMSKGDTKQAVKTWEQLLRDHRETRFLADALVGIARAKLSEGDLGGAQKGFEKAISEVRNKGMGDYWVQKVSMEAAQVDIAKKDWGAAAKKYRAVAQASRNFDDIRSAAVVGQCTAMVEQGQTSAAQTMLDEILSKAKDDAVVAQAYTLLGHCHAKGGKKEDALMAYLRVVILYPHIGTVAPRAYYEASAAFAALGGDENKTRSAQLKRELKERFPRSEWAKKG